MWVYSTLAHPSYHASMMGDPPLQCGSRPCGRRPARRGAACGVARPSA
eukprot:CAMPEP_0115874086 /NCGR_PEP_ID=MMETSP0287-20121206/24347_1 /TAXON_ID=412157 /ORGANISM="Chrysochromulina rotalis, Strain UIO044" /LENGTH=47 /DNA_ID= /DNA_START= /DNA_END= /DNA_ORIENTATION=